MKFSLYKHYGAKNSAPVFEAFAQGLARHGHEIVYHDDSADVAVIWSVLWKGRMIANRDIWQLFQQSQRPVVVLEVGALSRGQTWRLGINGIGLASAVYGRGQSLQRAQDLGLCELATFPERGKYVLITLQQSQSLQWQGMPPVLDWLSSVVQKIKQQCDLDIVVRPHPRQKIDQDIPDVILQHPRPMPGSYDDFDFDQALANAWCLISWSSNTSIEAGLRGVPVITGPDSLAAPIGTWQLDNVGSLQPIAADVRERWIADLVYHEWRLSELAQGVPISTLISRLESI